MADEQDEGAEGKRIKIGDLPVPETELTEEEEKGVSGGRAQPSPGDELRGQPSPDGGLRGQPSPGDIGGQPTPEAI